MEPIEFKNMALYLSKDLSKDNPMLNEEVIRRTIINRYYYYIFVRLRDIIIALDGREEVEEILMPPEDGKRKYGIGTHAFLINYIKEIGRKYSKINRNVNIFKIATKINTLFGYRKTADYRLDKLVSEEMVKDSEKLIADIEKSFGDIVDAIVKLQALNNLPNCKIYLKK